MQINHQLAAILLPAYAPCPAFSGACSSCMRWIPFDGHIPRGFFGATGGLEEVELVLVSAEPGDPFQNQTYATGSAQDRLQSASAFAYDNLKHHSDRYSVNIRFILNSCFPGTSFDDQMRRTWITNSVLCSAPREGATYQWRLPESAAIGTLKSNSRFFHRRSSSLSAARRGIACAVSLESSPQSQRLRLDVISGKRALRGLQSPAWFEAVMSRPASVT